ncbi:hypothetical protein C7M84_004441 [Penaeus vannamei]|uniref:Uncharacterized protein n=1 Tax=Penaeus vannamei TaxID=6689 RepID=A0A3R7PFX6_PENVA|nr:hypothetical protein C7M84_004441 [Penaeus vannamei]
MGLERSEEDFLCGYGACCNPGDIMHGAVIGAGTIKGLIQTSNFVPVKTWLRNSYGRPRLEDTASSFFLISSSLPISLLHLSSLPSAPLRPSVLLFLSFPLFLYCVPSPCLLLLLLLPPSSYTSSHPSLFFFSYPLISLLPPLFVHFSSSSLLPPLPIPSLCPILRLSFPSLRPFLLPLSSSPPLPVPSLRPFLPPPLPVPSLRPFLLLLSLSLSPSISPPPLPAPSLRPFLLLSSSPPLPVPSLRPFLLLSLSPSSSPPLPVPSLRPFLLLFSLSPLSVHFSSSSPCPLPPSISPPPLLIPLSLSVHFSLLSVPLSLSISPPPLPVPLSFPSLRQFLLLLSLSPLSVRFSSSPPLVSALGTPLHASLRPREGNAAQKYLAWFSRLLSVYTSSRHAPLISCSRLRGRRNKAPEPLNDRRGGSEDE